jgi:hypothetical protein
MAPDVIATIGRAAYGAGIANTGRGGGTPAVPYPRVCNIAARVYTISKR